VILSDVNLLLYAHNGDAPEHERARAWLEDRLSTPEPFAFAWQTISAFLRIATSRALFTAPLAASEGAAIVSSWLERPMVYVLEPGPRFWGIASPLIASSNSRGPLVPDALLAALAIEHGATLATHDADFRRFPGLSLVDPIAA
jgi:toxin-antitoxin system PIN domain toxin